MFKQLRSLIFVISILLCISLVVGFLKLTPSFATDESPTEAEKPPTPSLTDGSINPYVPTQKWIDAYAEEDKIKVLGDIQPGSAVYMRELAARIADLYHAARVGNWKLADYQMEYIRKTMQANRVTRPKRTALFTSYLADSIGAEDNPAPGSLQAAVNSESFSELNKALKLAVKNCNACHVATNHSYVIYKLPKGHQPVVPLEFAPIMG